MRTAFDHFAELYTRAGGWQYPGYLDEDEQHGYIGPFVWSEADLKHRFATFLEDEFPGAVHLEMPVRPGTRSDLDPVPAGTRGWIGIDWRRFHDEVPRDMQRLSDHRHRGRCAVAAMLVCDDSGRFASRVDELTLPRTSICSSSVRT